MNTLGRIIVALDGLNQSQTLTLMAKLNDSPCADSVAAFKIHDLYDQHGPMIVSTLAMASKRKIWVDLKLHDVPRTVGFRAAAVKDSGAYFLTVHASGGVEMMRKAVENGPPAIIAISVLTSLTEEETHLLCGQPTKAAVLQRARMAKLANTWGLVCSAHEVGFLKRQPELNGLKLIVPGIRLGGKDSTDANQKRVDTPAAAIAAGADYIVVGSEITTADDPAVVLSQIGEQIYALNNN